MCQLAMKFTRIEFDRSRAKNSLNEASSSKKEKWLKWSFDAVRDLNPLKLKVLRGGAQKRGDLAVFKKGSFKRV